eukprot:TRINITY_DN11986_c0_g1_i1.p1 TRINITY_DN11986_c0_g1~~TRINITY_DN11986_c0_g1_i1.p1  ORF type:complete len:232 (+),score=23.56 TRINITY_DN11986_c0_g1_i1:56-751(+)
MLSSRLVQYDDSQVAKFIASALWKMCIARQQTVNELDDTRLYVVVAESGWHFRSIKWTFDSLLPPHLLPGEELNKLVLIQDLGHGADGRVWKAASLKGHQYVLKFPLDSNAPFVAEREYSDHRACNQDARTATLNSTACLLMPVYYPVDRDKLCNTAAQDEIVAFVRHVHENCRRQHDDLKMAHIMLALPGAVVSVSNLRFIDLRRMSVVPAGTVFDELSVRGQLFPHKTC